MLALNGLPGHYATKSQPTGGMLVDHSALGGHERDKLLHLIEHCADLARTETLPHFRRAGLVAEDKGGQAFDPVTIADRAAELAIRKHLTRSRPMDGIVGEEFAPVQGSSGLTWIIDPVDGTRAFMSGTPCWGVLIALADQSGPFLGVIDQPYIGERFIGGLGLAHMSGPHGQVPLRCRDTADLSQAILFTTFPEIGTQAERAAFDKVARACRLTRYGLDCYAYALVALGQVDLVIEAGLKAHDIAAPCAVIQAAGGVVTDWQGNAVGPTGQVLAAANVDIHAQAMALLNT